MGTLWEWVRNTTLIVMLLSCLEMLLPEGSMRGYLKFVFSLVLLAVVAAPLSALVLPQTESVLGYAPVSQESPPQSARNETQNTRNSQSAQSEGLIQVQTKQIAQVYEEKLTEQLIAGLEEKFAGISVESVEIYINNEIHGSRYAKPERAVITIDDPDLKREAARYTANLLQIEERNVTVAFSEE